VNYNEEIENYKRLVEVEGRQELRNELAGCYNDRGIDHENRGNFNEAVLDYNRAIQLYEQLVMKEGYQELRNELALSLFNRGIIRCRKEEWKGAVEDIDKSGEMLQELINEGQKQLIWQFLKMAGFRISFVRELGNIKKTVEWANNGLRWMMEKAKKGDKSKEVMEASHMFMDELNRYKELLLREGLDKDIYNLFDLLLNRNKQLRGYN
jgi:tetratricopeptide (TPR) repeat protein